MSPSESLSRERRDLLESLGRHRGFLRFTVGGLTEEQARMTPTASVLSLGGLVKHVAATEAQWAEFAALGQEAFGGGWSDAEAETGAEEAEPGAEEAQGGADEADWSGGFSLTEEETLEAALADYERVAARTDDLVRELDLDAEWPLPEAPWFEAGASWSVRRVMLHIIAETSQHAGHADILRETIDGQRTMG